MPRFHGLTVTDVKKTIRDAVVVTLQPDEPEAFAFVQGQYLTFRRDFDGEELRRSYSICAGRHDGLLQVGIKRVDGGAFSTWANTELEVGDQLEAMTPMGQFFAEADDDAPRHYLGFAAGSGITPVLSILRMALQDEPDCRFTLVYSNSNVNTIMFREELEDLKNLHMGRLNVIHVLSDESQDIDLFRGRVDKEKCALLFQSWINIESVSMTFICGPEPMMLAVSEALKEHGVSEDRIRFELFASAQPGRAPQRTVTAEAASEGVPARVTLDGESRRFTMPRDTSLLQSAIDNNVDPPFACRAGVCSTCKAKVLKGEVEMIANHALEDYEVEAGFVLTCQSYPVSETVEWDYDQAGH